MALGATLLEATQKAGIDLVASCGGAGFCGTCLVKIIQGDVSPLSAIEMDAIDPRDLQEGLRLACQTVAYSDVKIFIPATSLVGSQQLQVAGLENELDLIPAVTVLDLSLTSPDLHDLRADMRRVDDALKQRGLPALKINPAGAGLLSNLSTQ